jgi:hypothetical protein
VSVIAGSRLDDPVRVGRYRVVGRLSRDDLGTVYLARSAWGQQVAARVIAPGFASRSRVRERLARELRDAATVSSPYAVQVIDADLDAAEPWVVTEYVAGPGLDQLVAEQGTLATARLLALAAALAKGLGDIHQAGLAHRGLQPSAVILAADRPRIAELGSVVSGLEALAVTGRLIGDPGYLSPEQADLEEAGPAGDIFSLGSVLAFGAAGESPFGRGRPPELLGRIVEDAPDLAGVPPAIRPLASWCLAKDPRDRPTAPEVLDWVYEIAVRDLGLDAAGLDKLMAGINPGQALAPKPEEHGPYPGAANGSGAGPPPFSFPAAARPGKPTGGSPAGVQAPQAGQAADGAFSAPSYGSAQPGYGAPADDAPAAGYTAPVAAAPFSLPSPPAPAVALFAQDALAYGEPAGQAPAVEPLAGPQIMKRAPLLAAGPAALAPIGLPPAYAVLEPEPAVPAGAPQSAAGAEPARRPREDGSRFRFLSGILPERAPVSARISLLVRITLIGVSGSAQLKDLHVGPSGATVTITASAPGLVPLGDLEQDLAVPFADDSEPVRFGFLTTRPGLHSVDVRAFAGGTFLGELTLQVSVESGAALEEGRSRVAVLTGLASEPGEVTLQVSRTANGYSFQLLSEALYPVVLTERLVGDPAQVAAKIVAELKMMARDQAPHVSPAHARHRLRALGTELWADVVPEAIRRQFWAQRDRIELFTVASDMNTVPWELIYPVDLANEDGFLVEQFPVVRRVYGQGRARSLRLDSGAAYVVPPRSPSDALDEVTALRGILPASVADRGLRGGLDEVFELLDAMPSLLHFAGHNAFTDDAGSVISLAGGPLRPDDLAYARQKRAFSAVSPLVFFNGRRTAGPQDPAARRCARRPWTPPWRTPSRRSAPPWPARLAATTRLPWTTRRSRCPSPSPPKATSRSASTAASAAS